jgi:hypothetical protein
LPGQTTVIIIWSERKIRFEQDKISPPTVKCWLKICNRQFDQKDNSTLIAQGNMCRLVAPKDEQLVGFRRLEDAKINQEYYYLTF